MLGLLSFLGFACLLAIWPDFIDMLESMEQNYEPWSL